MSFYNTGNPVPSIDPRDLDDNAKHIDELTNSTFPTFTDRLGTQRKTLFGLEADVAAVVDGVPLPSGSPQSPGVAAAATAGVLFNPTTFGGPGGGSIGVQTFAFDERARRIYTLQLNGVGSGNLSTINRFDLDGGIGQTTLGNSTPVSSDVGHQGLAVELLDSPNFRLWTTGYADSRQAVRYSYTDGAALGDIQLFTLFGPDFESNTSCTPTISYGQTYLVAYGTKTGATNTTVRVFNLADLVAGGPGDYSGQYVTEWDTVGLVDATHPTQGIASDGVSVWLVAGNNDINEPKRFQMYTLAGTLISSDEDFQVGRAQALLDGAGTVYEPEGLALLRVGPSLMLCVGVISGDLGTRFSRFYALGLKDSLHTSQVSLAGNNRSTLKGLTATGRQGMQLRGGIDGVTGAGFDLLGAGDSTNANQIGIVAGGVDTYVGSITRTGNNLNFLSLLGEFRFSAPAGQVIRLQNDGITQATITGTGPRIYVTLAPVSTGTVTNGSAALHWADFFSDKATFSGPITLGAYTLATLPSAAAFPRGLIDVTDATGGPKTCRSNSSVWQILNTTTTVS